MLCIIILTVFTFHLGMEAAALTGRMVWQQNIPQPFQWKQPKMPEQINYVSLYHSALYMYSVIHKCSTEKNSNYSNTLHVNCSYNVTLPHFCICESMTFYLSCPPTGQDLPVCAGTATPRCTKKISGTSRKNISSKLRVM